MPAAEARRERAWLREEAALRHQSGGGQQQRVVVGWAGRLESQKSPGLFLRLARLTKVLYQDQRSEVRVCFLVMGGGTFLGDHLEEAPPSKGPKPMRDMAETYGLRVGRCRGGGAASSEAAAFPAAPAAAALEAPPAAVAPPCRAASP